MNPKTTRNAVAAAAAAALLSIATLTPATADDAGLMLPRDVIERAPSLDLFAMSVAQTSNGERGDTTTASNRPQGAEKESNLTRSEKLWKRFERQAGFN